MPEGDADRIREYATGLVEQARREGKGRITIRAGDVHKALGLRHAHPNVCQAIRGNKFHSKAGVNLVDCDLPPSGQGANAYFIFSILPQSRCE